MANGKLMDFYFLRFPLSSSFLPPPVSLLIFAEAVSSCFKKCSDGVVNYDWKLEIAMDGGGYRAWLFEMQKECLCSWLAFVCSC